VINKLFFLNVDFRGLIGYDKNHRVDCREPFDDDDHDPYIELIDDDKHGAMVYYGVGFVG
jgi:hypothetical protein